MANKYAHYAENSTLEIRPGEFQTARIQISNVKKLNSGEKSARMRTTVEFNLGHI